MSSKALMLAGSCVLTVLLLAAAADPLKFNDEHLWKWEEEVEEDEEERTGESFKFPFQDPSLSWDRRVDDLLSRLTLQEVVSQTKAVYGQHTPPIARLKIRPYVWITECLHGHSETNGTSFPMALGLAASFSDQLIYDVAKAISYEVRAHWNGNRRRGIYETFSGLSCFSPVINIMRHPLWGRNYETYGEDPFLAGKLVQGYVRGLQGNHSRYVRANAGCKHFDVHGGPENIPVDRHSFNAKVSMRDWRMTFLPQFKMCVEAGTYSLMCSYNRLNGIPTCAHKQLLTDITRNEWGFKGYVVSDAGAITDIIDNHRYLKTRPETAAACIKAGCNLELATDVYDSTPEAINASLITEREVRRSARPLWMTRMRLGEFDPERMNPYNRIDMSCVQSDGHRQLALRAAMETFVLLKNDDGLLPLKKNGYKRLAIVGPFADEAVAIYGGYSPKVIRNLTTTVADGLKRLADSVAVASGCKKIHCEEYEEDEVVGAVDGADLVVVALGTGSGEESEGNDRPSIDLPGRQLEVLLDAVKSANGHPVILLLFNGGPLDVTWAKLNPKVSAIMECFFPGERTGDALYLTLTASGGSSSVPAGRLPATWPAYLKQVPSITDYNMAGHTYRYYDGEPLYPFGYGLSYTSFLYTYLRLSSDSIVGGENLTVTVGVLNTGHFDADEVIQVYASWPDTDIPVPKIQLVAFTRQLIKAGKQKVVELVVTPERIAVWGEDDDWTFVKGTMKLYAGGQQPNQETKTGSNVLQASLLIA